MSGGSWDYLFGRIHDAADALQTDRATDRHYKLELNEEQREKRRKLGELLEKVAHALHEIEWVDSSDCSYPDDTKAIDAVFAHIGRKPLIEMRYDENNVLDEIVAKEARVQFENMGGSWALILDAGDAQVNLSIGGRLKRPLVVEQSGSVIATHPKRD